jgi:ADP-ribose pyrophosphatase
MNKSLTNPSSGSSCIDADDKSSWLYWDTVSREKLADCKVFTVNKVTATSKCAQNKTGRFFTLDCDPWVNVVALTDDGEVVMVKQYRHGVEDLTLEIPGGNVDASDADPAAAAVRELREETGCVAERWSFLGKNHPNPAIQDNLCYTYLAEGIRQIESPKFDNSGTEKIEISYVKLADIGSLIRQGVITHALVITAFHFLMLKRAE